MGAQFINTIQPGSQPSRILWPGVFIDHSTSCCRELVDTLYAVLDILVAEADVRRLTNHLAGVAAMDAWEWFSELARILDQAVNPAQPSPDAFEYQPVDLGFLESDESGLDGLDSWHTEMDSPASEEANVELFQELTRATYSLGMLGVVWGSC